MWNITTSEILEELPKSFPVGGKWKEVGRDEGLSKSDTKTGLYINRYQVFGSDRHFAE